MNIKSSFNLLINGINFNKKRIKEEEEKKEQSNKINNIKDVFPDLTKEKENILKYKKMLSKLIKNTEISQENKDKKINEIKSKINTLNEELYNKLRLISSNYDEINPLVSFEEIQKNCKFRNLFSNMIKEKYNFKHPSPIQSVIIPLLYNKKNVIASSETGSGKTFSYLLPIIHNSLLNKLKNKNNKIIIILPTKELAKQIYNETILYINYYCENELKTKYINKGMIISLKSDHINFLKNNDIFISTPKNILDLIEVCKDDLINKLIYLILDEADKFFDLGFIEIIDEILSKVKEKNFITKGFFSATILDSLGDIITSNIFNSIKISIGLANIPARHINQEFIYCTNEEGKLIGIKNLIHSNVEYPMLIFVEGINKLRNIYEKIKYEIPKISYIHSKMTKIEREEQINNFREGNLWILMCSDLLSRGIDFKNVKTVVNFDCPYRPVNYIHRIGRTGRAGKNGNAYTFIVDNDVKLLKGISGMINDMIKNNENNVKCPKWLINLKKK